MTCKQDGMKYQKYIYVYIYICLKGTESGSHGLS